MSLSPTTSNDYEQPNGKRRRTASFAAGPSNGPSASNGPARSEMGSPSESASGLAAPPTPGGGGSAPIPKRGARACTNCRKGKNRCEGEVSRRVVFNPHDQHRRLCMAIHPFLPTSCALILYTPTAGSDAMSTCPAHRPARPASVWPVSPPGPGN